VLPILGCRIETVNGVVRAKSSASRSPMVTPMRQ
jgi:hypothetical protein